MFTRRTLVSSSCDGPAVPGLMALACLMIVACSKASEPAPPEGDTPALATAGTAAPGARQPSAAPAPAPAPPATSYAEGTDYLVLERVMFLDEMGFDRPVEAFSVLLPRGWKSEGGVRWGRIDQCRSELVQTWIEAASPDGTMRFEAMPPRGFGWSEDPGMLQLMQVGAQQGGCGLNRPFDAAQYIAGAAEHELGARASDIRVDESGVERMRPADEQANAISRQFGNGMTQSSTVAYGKLTWPDGSEGIAHAGVTNIITQKPDMLNGGVTTFSTTVVFHSVVMRFPAARRDEGTKLLGTIMTSHRVNPVWREAKDRFLTELGNAEHAARMEKIRLVGEQSRAYAQARSDAMDRQMRDWERKQDAQDRQVKGFIQTIREVETWNDGSGGVELSAGYNQAWSRGDGRYILSNKAGFDPSSVFQDQAWQPMTRAR